MQPLKGVKRVEKCKNRKHCLAETAETITMKFGQ